MARTLREKNAESASQSGTEEKKGGREAAPGGAMRATDRCGISSVDDRLPRSCQPISPHAAACNWRREDVFCLSLLMQLMASLSAADKERRKIVIVMWKSTSVEAN
ncbi:hypothetical protein E2C01_008287 [Portunus trituberculatus]|uniref:Uncharacterized protein n=1 Tax=Portunus trituberculatus TaxID=210409 RepID=A0A5B7D2E5_PORTR|nr:hypothetical protein [Portunus trituberculatus]